jgi:hypothetical protein
MRTFSILPLVFILGLGSSLCGPTTHSQSEMGNPVSTDRALDPDEDERWRSFVEALLDDPDAVARALEKYRHEHGIPQNFWPRVGVPDSVALAAGAIDHPCGSSLVRSVRAIPHDDELIVGETVLEYDEAGEIIRQWQVPVDLTVAGVSDDEVVLTLPLRTRGGLLYADLAIKPNGSFRFVSGMTYHEPEYQECPSFELFGDSVYVVCLSVRDEDRDRLIAYEFPCT